jgi:DNA-binding MarR family transcriptional regulator
MNVTYPTVTDGLAEDLLTLWRVLRQVSQQDRRGEITPEQFWLLRLLGRQGPSSIGELAGALGIMSSSVTAACKRLEGAGLVRRERQAGDERVVMVSLTERGEEQIAHWRRARREALARLLAPLDEEEQTQLQRLIERVLAAAEEADFAGDAADHSHTAGGEKR